MLMKNALLLFSFLLLSLAGANAQNVQDSSAQDTLIKDTLFHAKDSTQSALKHDSIRSINNIAKLKPSTNVNLVCRRTPPPIQYYVDGVKVIGSLNYPRTISRYISNDDPVNRNSREYTEEEINKLRPFTVNDLVSQTAGVLQTQNGLSFKGSREDGTAYYLDGMRLINPILYVSNELLIK